MKRAHSEESPSVTGECSASRNETLGASFTLRVRLYCYICWGAILADCVCVSKQP